MAKEITAITRLRVLVPDSDMNELRRLAKMDKSTIAKHARRAIHAYVIAIRALERELERDINA